jgi:hypothetical protein
VGAAGVSDSLGWRVRSTVSGGGLFFCPLEGADRQYVRTQVRRWLAPFGMPLIPYHRLGDYIRCTECHRSFTDDVLEIATTHELSVGLEKAAVGLLSLVVVRLGGGDGARAIAEGELRRFVRRSTGNALEMPAPDLVGVVERLSSVCAHLEMPGRRDLLAAAVRVAYSEGVLNGPNFAALHAAGGALRLPMATVRSLIVSAGVRAD